MLKATLVICLACLLSACETFGSGNKNTCGGSGHKIVKVEYGDGKLVVAPVVHVNKKKELRFKLFPQRQSELGYDYTKAEVTMKGKTDDASWLNTSGAWDPGRYLVVCVKEELAKKNYDYSVTIRKAGTDDLIAKIDPRVVVE